MTAAPWAGLLIVTATPYRLLQALFLDQLFEVGGKASQYGHLLGATALMTVAAIVVAFWGRAVYARACRLAIGRGAAPGRESLRVPPVAFASYVLTASAAMVVGWLALFTVVGYIFAVIMAGLAIGTMELNERIGVRGPFRNIFRYTQRVGIPLALVFVFFCAFFVALVNLGVGMEAVAWLGSAVGGIDAPNWHMLFSLSNRRFILLLIAGALVVIEPFWIASHVVYVRKAGAQETGDDLRAWFEELKAS